MYTLYYKPGACSMAVHVLLNETGQEVKLAQVDSPSTDADYLRINPLGVVPALKDDGMVLREGAAILLYLADKHQSPLLPRGGEARARAVEALMFCNATMHPAYSRAFFMKRALTGEAQEQGLTAAAESINTLWKEVEARLSKTSFLGGSEPTLADILITVIANWSGAIGRPILIGPKAKALFKTIITRPAYRKALATEQVDYKAAA